MQSRPQINTITFDLDEILIDSAEIKSSAFGQLFRRYGREIEQAVLRDHQASEGVSRFVKFERWYRDLLSLEYSQEIGFALSKEYDHIIANQIVYAPWLPGAREFLNDWHDKIPFYLATSTPQDQLQNLLKARSMESFFHSAWGYPTLKTTALRTVIAEQSIPAEFVLMVGDSESDSTAANSVGVPFCRFLHSSSSWKPKQGPTRQITNMNTLPHLFSLRTTRF